MRDFTPPGDDRAPASDLRSSPGAGAPGLTSRSPQIPLFERLQIESQANCNRACWFCPRTYDRSGKYLNDEGRAVLHQLPTALILDLLDQARALGFQGPVGFHHYSEPLLDKRNLMLAEEAIRRGMRPYLHTNGDVLRENVALCREVVRLYGLIVVGIYDYASTEERDREKAFWGARLAGANLRFSSIGTEAARSVPSMGIPRAQVPTDPRMSVPDLLYPNGPCHRPLLRLIVQHDGTMCNCCEDTTGAFDLGNVHEHSLADLWYGPRHVAVVEDLVAGHRDRHALCRVCPLPPAGPLPDGERIQILPRRLTRPGP